MKLSDLHELFDSAHHPMKLIFQGQIRGGKNNMVVTRTGHRFPKPEWAAWRDAQVLAIKRQLPQGFKIITEPTNIRLTYFAGDKRRRDMPAIIDAIFHVLEKAGVVEDDTLLWVSESSRHYDKTNPVAIIEFLVWFKQDRDAHKADAERRMNLIHEIWNITESYSDGSPDATDHDKLCNEISGMINVEVKAALKNSKR